jgi:hypothetical protein
VSLRHAAALVLVGWYLMAPTAFNDNAYMYDRSLPLSKWKILASFDSASDCEKTQGTELRQLDRTLYTIKDINKLKDQDKWTPAQRNAFLFLMSQCVATTIRASSHEVPTRSRPCADRLVSDDTRDQERQADAFASSGLGTCRKL